VDLFNQFFDNRGLLRQWSEKSAINNPNFKTNRETSVGQVIRDLYNQSLELEYKNNDEFLKKKATVSMSWVLKADVAFASNNNKMGNRYLNRSRVLLDYAINHPRVKYYGQYSMSINAIQLFNVDIRPHDYMSYQLVSVSSKIASDMEIQNPSILNTVTVGTFNQALSHSQSKPSIQSLIHFNDHLDTLYAIYDDILNGLPKLKKLLSSKELHELSGGYIFGSQESIYIYDADSKVEDMGLTYNTNFQTGRAIGLILGGTAQLQFAAPIISAVGNGVGAVFDSTGVGAAVGVPIHAITISISTVVAGRATVHIAKGTALLYSKGGNLLFSLGKHLKSGFVKDYSTKNTKNVSGQFNNEREARALAREKLGKEPIQIEPGKLRSADGKWQYRSKPEDLKGHESKDTPHIHLERLDSSTGEILENWHLRWD